MPYVKNGSVSIHYQDWGVGAPAVFIHGWPLSHEMWEYQTTTLARHGVRCIAYDRRGFGQSDKPWGPYDYNTLAEDLNVLLTQLDLRGVTLIGFSMGGGEVLRYLTRFGTDRIAKAVLIGSVLPYLSKTDDNEEGVDVKTFNDMLDKLHEDRPAFLADFGKSFYGMGMLSKPVSQAWLDYSTMLALRASHRATTECVHTFAETDFRAELPILETLPTLIIHGTSDKTVPIEASSKRIHEAMPSLRYVEYDGGAHGLFASDRDKLNRDLLAFIEEPVGVVNLAGR